MRSIRLLTAAVILSLSLLAASCPTTPGGEGARLAAQRARWSLRGVRHYRYEFQRSCECLPEMAPPALIEVRDGVVVGVTHARTGESLTGTHEANRPTIDDLFAELERALRQADRVSVEYDPTFGYPARVNIDWDVNVADEERIYVASGLTPLP